MNDERTSSRAASAASRTLRDRTASDDAKTAAASALSQADNRDTETRGTGDAATELETGNSKLETAVTRVQFAPSQTSATLDIGHGEYRRRFNAKDQPFEVVGLSRTEKNRKDEEVKVSVLSAAEELQLLLDTGLFVVVEQSGQSL